MSPESSAADPTSVSAWKKTVIPSFAGATPVILKRLKAHELVGLPLTHLVRAGPDWCAIERVGVDIGRLGQNVLGNDFKILKAEQERSKRLRSYELDSPVVNLFPGHVLAADLQLRPLCRVGAFVLDGVERKDDIVGSECFTVVPEGFTECDGQFQVVI